MTKKINVCVLIIGMMVLTQMAFGQTKTDSTYYFVSWMYYLGEDISVSNDVVKVPNEWSNHDVWNMITEHHNKMIYVINTIEVDKYMYGQPPENAMIIASKVNYIVLEYVVLDDKDYSLIGQGETLLLSPIEMVPVFSAESYIIDELREGDGKFHVVRLTGWHNL